MVDYKFDLAGAFKIIAGSCRIINMEINEINTLVI